MKTMIALATLFMAQVAAAQPEIISSNPLFPAYCKTEQDAQRINQVFKLETELVSLGADKLSLKVTATPIRCAADQNGKYDWVNDNNLISYSYDATKFAGRPVQVVVETDYAAIAAIEVESGALDEKDLFDSNKSVKNSETLQLDINKVISPKDDSNLKSGGKLVKTIEVFIKAAQTVTSSDGYTMTKTDAWTQVLKVEFTQTPANVLSAKILK